EQTFTEWNCSVFADPTSRNALNCSSGSTCHMGREFSVPIASPPLPHPTMPARTARHLHDFPAIDVALTDFPQKDAQLAAVKSKLGLEFRIQICVDPQLGSGITVILENLNAGHYFPSGAAQDRRVWTELHAYQKGTEIMSNGVVPTGVAAVDVPGTWVIYQKGLQADGA